MSDYVLAYMKKKSIKLTRKNYLDLAFLGRPPKELSAEEEEELPPQVRFNHEDPKDSLPPPPTTEDAKAAAGLTALINPNAS